MTDLSRREWTSGWGDPVKYRTAPILGSLATSPVSLSSWILARNQLLTSNNADNVNAQYYALNNFNASNDETWKTKLPLLPSEHRWRDHHNFNE